MKSQRAIQISKYFYSKLLMLYPPSYQSQFGQPMMQIFSDMCRENLGKALVTTSGDFIITLPQQYTLLIINYMNHNNKLQNIPYVIFGLILLIPFALIVLFSVIGFNQQVGNLMARYVPITLTFVIIFPIIAFLVNLVVLIKAVWNKSSSYIFSKEFVIKNSFSLIITGIALLAAIFLPIHDAVPCMVHGIQQQGLHNIKPLLEVCQDA